MVIVTRESKAGLGFAGYCLRRYSMARPTRSFPVALRKPAPGRGLLLFLFSFLGGFTSSVFAQTTLTPETLPFGNPPVGGAFEGQAQAMNTGRSAQDLRGIPRLPLSPRGRDLSTPSRFVYTGSLNPERDYHTATVLSNGMVLVVGGVGSSSDGLDSAELYDPATGIFTPTGSMSTARVYHTATLLNNGMVLIAGGEYLASAELYD